MAAAALAAALFEFAKGYFTIPGHELIDPDSYMRLVRIRDGLRAGWFTSVVAADNAGHGTVVYWSHMLDGLILLLRAPLLLVMDGQKALLLAGALTGPLIAGALAAALVWAPAPLMTQRPVWRWLWAAPLAVVLAPALTTYGMFGYVHYHLPLVLIALLAAASGGRAAAGDSQAALWCGALAAADIWLSPEALPYVLMAMGTLGAAWCQRPGAMGRPLRLCFSAFCAVMLIAMLADPPFEGRFAPQFDRISVVYGALAAMLCALAWLLGPVGKRLHTVWARAAAAGALAAATLAVWLALFPMILSGLAGLIPPEDVAAYFGAIDEMHPLPRTLAGALMLAPPLLAVACTAALAWQRRSLLWAYATLCGAVVAVLALQHIRFLAYGEAAASIMLPVVLDALSASRLPELAQSLLRPTAIAAFLLLPILPVKAPAAPTAGAATARGEPCHVSAIAPALRTAPDAVVLTEISDTPEILWLTPVRTVGSLYHRGIAAFIAARAAWRSPPSPDVPRELRATGATYILACDSLGRTALIDDLPATTLQDRLNRHDVPPWLHAAGQAGGYTLYRIGG
jgi:hypothetical protein